MCTFTSICELWIPKVVLRKSLQETQKTISPIFSLKNKAVFASMYSQCFLWIRMFQKLRDFVKKHIDFSKKLIKNDDLRPYSSLICMTPHRKGTSNVENCIESREIWACQFLILLSALSTMHTKCDIGSSIFSGVCEMRFLSELYFANYWANYNLMNHNDLMSL